jgi:hypothetical protein
MVKIPSFDDLKKAGSNLMDSAKSGSLVDKFKAGVESIGENMAQRQQGKPADRPTSTDPIINQIQALEVSLVQIQELQATQTTMINEAMLQLADLHKAVAATTSTTGENK